jgi:hypothetical protein
MVASSPLEPDESIFAIVGPVHHVKPASLAFADKTGQVDPRQMSRIRGLLATRVRASCTLLW